MTVGLGIALAAMALAGIGFAMSSADYTGLLGYFQRPDSSEDQTPAAGDSELAQTQPHLIYARPPLLGGDDTTATERPTSNAVPSRPATAHVDLKVFTARSSRRSSISSSWEGS